MLSRVSIISERILPFPLPSGIQSIVVSVKGRHVMNINGLRKIVDRTTLAVCCVVIIMHDGNDEIIAIIMVSSFLNRKESITCKIYEFL